MSKKPSFANLGSRLAQKAPEIPDAVRPLKARSPAAVEASSPDVIRPSRPSDGRRGILVRARPEAWKALKQVALDGERTLQDVMTEAINDILSKNGKAPLA